MIEWRYHPIDCTCPQDIVDKRGRCDGYWSLETGNLRIYLTLNQAKYTIECAKLGIRRQFDASSELEAQAKAIEYMNELILQYKGELDLM